MAARTAEEAFGEVVRVLQEAMRRIRNLEEIARSMEAKQMSVETTSLKRTEEMRTRAGALEQALEDLNTKILKLETEVSNTKKFLNKVSLRSDLEEFKSYIDLLSPLRTHYATQTEVKAIVREELADRPKPKK
ncbi:MAG: hypothetical protein HYS81_00710 [Candidatus Aenigmatarchaeota archaeon]|nr:MAG: hypothetical protein HYS81_00710 [Candidatus Aenigmarchaeota archaeon]